jgi:ElaA protein
MARPDYQLDFRNMGGLSAHELYELLKLRVDVFVVEQNCPYPELDGKDERAIHLMLRRTGELLAAARILPPEATSKVAKIGRVVVASNYRGEKLGDALMREAIGICEAHFPDHDIGLSAQSHLQAFYRSLGFQPVSEEYLEDGIPHIDMLRPATIAAE